MPTISPIAGTTTSEVNVRVDTSTASQSLGTIPAFSAIQVIGKDPSGIWLQVIFNNSAGWVRADFVQLSNATAEIPVVGAETGEGSGLRGVVLRGVNVRSGPGRDFDSLGLLNQNDVVAIRAKDSNSEWILIEYPAAPDGNGWVAAEYLQMENPDAIPVNETNEEAQNPAPTGETANPSETVTTTSAVLDGDSAEVPLTLLDLSASAGQIAQVNGEVSAPQGDGQDWIGFSSEFTNVAIQVLCQTGSVKVELLSSNASPAQQTLGCGEIKMIRVAAKEIYLLQVSPISNGDSVHVKYQIRLEAGQ